MFSTHWTAKPKLIPNCKKSCPIKKSSTSSFLLLLECSFFADPEVEDWSWRRLVSLDLEAHNELDWYFGIYLLIYFVHTPWHCFPSSALCTMQSLWKGIMLTWWISDTQHCQQIELDPVDDDALRWSGWWWWWWPNTINFSVGEQIYQVGSSASTSCKLCKRTSSLKTHFVDKLLVHEIWDSKFRQNLKNIYREHLVIG